MTSLADKLEGLAEKATGPWEIALKRFSPRLYILRKDATLDEEAVAEVIDSDKAALIVELHNALPAIITALRDVERMREALDAIARIPPITGSGQNQVRRVTLDGCIEIARQALGGGDA